MISLDIVYDENRCIPIEPPPGDPTAWADDTARAFGARADLDEAAIDRVAKALVDLTRLATPERRILLVASIDAAVLAPLTITVSEDALSEAEQAEFLWSRDAVLPPTVEVIETEELGAGVTVALLQREGERQFATRRWLFAGAAGAVGALLGPVTPYGLSLVEESAGHVLASSHFEGFTPAADREIVERFEAASARAGERWA